MSSSIANVLLATVIQVSALAPDVSEPNLVEIKCSSAVELTGEEFRSRFCRHKSCVYFYLGSDAKFDYLECKADRKERNGVFKVSRTFELKLRRYSIGAKTGGSVGPTIFPDMK